MIENFFMKKNGVHRNLLLVREYMHLAKCAISGAIYPSLPTQGNKQRRHSDTHTNRLTVATLSLIKTHKETSTSTHTHTKNISQKSAKISLFYVDFSFLFNIKIKIFLLIYQG